MLLLPQRKWDDPPKKKDKKNKREDTQDELE